MERIEERRLAVGQARAVVQKSSKKLAYQLADALRRSGYIDVVPIGMASFAASGLLRPSLPEDRDRHLLQSAPEHGTGCPAPAVSVSPSTRQARSAARQGMVT